MRLRYLSWQWFFVFGLMFLSIIALGIISYGARQSHKLLEAEVNKHNRTLSLYIPGELNKKISSWLDGTHQKFLDALEIRTDFESIGRELIADQSIAGFFYIDLDSSQAVVMESTKTRGFRLNSSKKESRSDHKNILKSFMAQYLSDSEELGQINLPNFSEELQILSGANLQIYHGQDWRSLFVSTVTHNNIKTGLVGIILDWHFLRRLLTVLTEKYPNVHTTVEGWGKPILISYSGTSELNSNTLNLAYLSSIGPFSLSNYMENVKIKVYYPIEWDSLGGPAFNSRYTQYFLERTKDMYELIIAPLTLLLCGLLLLFFNLRNSARKIRIQNDWIQNIAHDIQTPIHAMGSVLDLLQESETNPNSQWNKLLRLELSRLHQTSRVFMQLARDDQATRQLTISKFSLDTLIERAVDVAELIHVGRQPKIKWTPEQAKFTIEADFDWLLDSLINLLDNASKYSPESPEIDLSFTKNETWFSITVSDQGYGIPDSELSNVTQPFYRVHSTKTEGIHGNGLGLSIVKRITMAHGGQVIIKPNSPRGVSVQLKLPIKAC